MHKDSIIYGLLIALGLTFSGAYLTCQEVIRYSTKLSDELSYLKYENDALKKELIDSQR